MHPKREVAEMSSSRHEEEYETEDPLYGVLSKAEQKVVSSIITTCVRLFQEDILHEIGEAGETFFTLNLAGFNILSLTKIRRIIHPHRARFRHYEVSHGNHAGGLSLLLSFYRGDSPSHRPLGHETRTSLRFNSYGKTLDSTNLSTQEKALAKQLIEQFCFHEKYPSGSLSATISDKETHFTCIFSNTGTITSGFVAEYLCVFKKNNLEIEFWKAPFETHVSVFRETERSGNVKKRPRE